MSEEKADILSPLAVRRQHRRCWSNIGWPPWPWSNGRRVLASYVSFPSAWSNGCMNSLFFIRTVMTTIAGSAMLSVSIALNAVSLHGTCTAAFVAIAAILGFGLGSIQTLGKITWLTWVGLISVCTSSKYSKTKVPRGLDFSWRHVQ